MRKKTMSSWRVWIGSPAEGLAAWKPYVVTARDKKHAVREVYMQITGVRRAPTPSWCAWSVRNVEYVGNG